MLFLQTGLRVSELVNLKLSDIDFTSREITVRQGKGRKDRVVPLVKQAEAALKAYLKVRVAQPEYNEVFIARNGTSMDPRTVRYRIQKYYKEAGIKKKASVHTLRHTFSTHQIHNGPDFSVVLFRPHFMLASEEYLMKAHKNQWLWSMPSPLALLWEP
jgi:integrase/recombinase XerC